MHQTHIHHSRWHLVSMRADQCFDVLEVGACCDFLMVRAGPSIDIEVHTANGRMPRRIILMFQFWLGGERAFEWHPIEPLYILLPICLDERVQFAIGNAI